MKEYDQAATAFQSHIDKVKDDSTINWCLFEIRWLPFVTSKYWPAMDATIK
jgi:hypothetical protein